MVLPLSINRWEGLPTWSDPRLATGTVPETKIRLRMREEVLPLFLAIGVDYNEHVAPLRYGECGAWNFRPANAGHGLLSDHGSGTAVDFNWGHEGAQGPRGGMATMSKQQIRACAQIKERFQVVIWGGDKARGGDYVQPKNWDPMHYALKPGTTVADVRRVIKELGIQPDGTIAHPVLPHVTLADIRLYKKSDSNAILQAALVKTGFLKPENVRGIWTIAASLAFRQWRNSKGIKDNLAAWQYLGRAYGFTVS